MMTIAASDGLKLFIPQVYDIVWSLIILVIVALFFHKFFMPKFNAIFDERAAKIEGNIAKAEQSKKDADAAKSKYEAQLSTARVEASKIRDDARAEFSHETVACKARDDGADRDRQRDESCRGDGCTERGIHARPCGAQKRVRQPETDECKIDRDQ